MISSLRKYQQPLMLVITIIIIIAFVWLWNGTSPQFGGHRPGEASYRIYDRVLQQGDVERIARRFSLASALNLNDLLVGLVGNASDQGQAVENFVWNSLIVEHEARRLGVAPTDSEVADAIKALPAFQTNGQFDPMKYQEFVQEMLMPRGFTDTQVEELLRDNLRARKLMELIGATVDVTPAEFDRLYTEDAQQNEVKLIALKLEDFVATAPEPTQEQIDAYRKRHASALVTPERRAVRFVHIGLKDEEKTLTGKERVEALQKLSDRTNDFVQALLGDGAVFEKVAGDFGLKVEKTALFSRAEPPKELAGVPQALPQAFLLSEKEPYSDAVEAADGFYVLAYDSVEASRPLTPEEARPKIVENLKQEAARNALTTKANEVRTKLAEALKAGKPLTEAAAALGVTVEDFPLFSRTEFPRENPLAPRVLEAAPKLPEGGLSEALATAEGSVIVHLVRRLPVDEKKIAEARGQQLNWLRFYKQASAFQQWLQVRRKEAHIYSEAPNDAREG